QIYQQQKAPNDGLYVVTLNCARCAAPLPDGMKPALQWLSDLSVVKPCTVARRTACGDDGGPCPVGSVCAAVVLHKCCASIDAWPLTAESKVCMWAQTVVTRFLCWPERVACSPICLLLSFSR